MLPEQEAAQAADDEAYVDERLAELAKLLASEALIDAAEDNRLEDCTMLLDQGASPVYMCPERGTSFLHLIARMNTTLPTRLPDEKSALPLASEVEEAAAARMALLKRVLQDPENVEHINAKDHKHGDTPLHYAISGPFPAAVEFLLTKSANPNLPNADMITPIQHAATTAYPAIIRSLLKHGANADAHTSKRHGPAAMTAFELAQKYAPHAVSNRRSDVAEASESDPLTPKARRLSFEVLHANAAQTAESLKMLADPAAMLSAYEKKGSRSSRRASKGGHHHRASQTSVGEGAPHMASTRQAPAASTSGNRTAKGARRAAQHAPAPFEPGHQPHDLYRYLKP